MYLTAVNTDSEIASCYSPTDGVQTMSNDALFRTGSFSYFESNIQFPKTLIAWFTGNICTDVFQTFIFMHLVIFHQVIMHFRFTFISFLVLRLPTSLFKDSSMCIGIALAAALWLILENYDAKLLKQQLFKVFWQYLIIGASFWNLNNSTHF